MSLLPLLINLMHPCWLKNRSKQKNYRPQTFKWKCIWSRTLDTTLLHCGQGMCVWTDHRPLRPAVSEAIGLFVKAVVGSWGFGHFLHDGFRLRVVLRPCVYRHMSSLQKQRCQLFLVPHTFAFSKLNLNMWTKPSDGGVKIHTHILSSVYLLATFGCV